MSPRNSQRLVLALAVLLPLAFAAFTHHAWEDYYITLRSSRNLVEGNGLVYNSGERVHTFTSPLGVLVPAACLVLAGKNDQLALWIFRALNAALLAGAASLVWRRTETLRMGRIGRVVLFSLLLTDAKLTDFATNGMETAMLVFFLLLLWSELESPGLPRPARLAAACAGLMWTRPDAFILIGALLVPHLVPRPRASGAPAPPWARLGRGVLLGALGYLPWLAWTWWYYGTPLPHTIIAKAAVMPTVNWAGMVLLPLRVLGGQSMLGDLFLPAYWTFGGWPAGVSTLAQVLAVVAAFGWVWPGLPAATRRLSLAVFLGAFYLNSIILFPWYVPPWSVLAFLAIAGMVDGAYTGLAAAGRRRLAAGFRLACLLVVGVQVLLLVAVAWQMRVQQRLIENHNRRAIGEWLRANAAPRDTVFLEPLGYIGYYSRLKTYDFPGMSSPEVTAAVRGGARRFADIIERLRPQWLVLRPAELDRPEFVQKPVLRDYQIVGIWDALPQLKAIPFLPGRPWIEADAEFVLLRRKPPAPPGS